MKLPIVKWPVLVALAISTASVAQENESAVPLRVGLESGNVTLESISIKLDGREVTVTAGLKNSKNRVHKVGWYASTPQFGILGTGEEHLDKTFVDVRTFIDGKMRKPIVYQRSYFLGHDITTEVIKAGLPPLPDLNVDLHKLAKLGAVNGMRIDQWHGYVNYAWTSALPANTSASIVVRYRALPGFGLADVDSDQFAQIVQQHCGIHAAVQRRIRSAVGDATQVVTERFEVPVPYMRSRDVEISIVQPHFNWLHARPLTTLVCGLPNEGGLADIAGTINASSGVLSVLIVSAIDTTTETKDNGHGK